MADNIDIIAPSDGTSDEKEKQQTESKAADDWKTIAGDKFKSEADLAKAYKDLEKKFGENSEEVRSSREFQAVIQPLLEEIRNDPEIFKTLDERLRKKGQPDSNQTVDKPKDGQAADQTEMRTVASDILLARFEEKHGIDKLPPDKQKELRRSIGEAVLSMTGTTLANVDLRRIGTVLENAYILANKDESKSSQESQESAQGDEAAFSSISSSQAKGETTLTPEEAKVADRLGLTRQQYLEGKKKPGK